MRLGPTRSFVPLIKRGNLALTLSILFVLTLLSSRAVHAQTFRVIHAFTGAGDGANPAAGLTIDRGGNLYGTAYFGGHDRGNCTGTGCGTVYKVSLHNSAWIFTRLYPFTGTGDGAGPNSRVTFSPDGTLYGSTYIGNNIYNLKPPPTASPATFASWKISLVHQFGSVGDGSSPSGGLTFASGSAVYGTTYSGGNWALCGGTGCGRVYELTRSNGSWMEVPLYDFTGQDDGQYPAGGVIFDHSGNFYGTTSQGGPSQFGVVFELTNSSGWQENTLYGFHGGSDGKFPLAGLIMDQSGNLYGATSMGGAGNGGTVFSLMLSNGNWISNLLSSLDGNSGTGPLSSLIMDSAGNLYGTTYSDGALGFGSVFKLTQTGEGWIYTSLYDFTGGSDGAYPVGGVVIDANGDVFGTTYAGGGTGSFCDANFGNQCGVIFEITP
jgi:uncharacterized repeat protein (TIGR03803 family)